jgi:hypothetical protein
VDLSEEVKWPNATWCLLAAPLVVPLPRESHRRRVRPVRHSPQGDGGGATGFAERRARAFKEGTARPPKAATEAAPLRSGTTPGKGEYKFVNPFFKAWLLWKNY